MPRGDQTPKGFVGNPEGRPPLRLEDRPLTAIQENFAREMILDPISTYSSAARRAGYAEGSSGAIGSALMKDPRIIKMIDEGQKASIKKFNITKERILQELAIVAFAKLGDTVMVSEDGRLVADKDSPLETSIEIGGKYGIIKKAKTIKAADKVAALVSIGKHLGMFKEQLEINGKVSLLDLIQKSFETKEIVDSTATPVESNSV